MDQLPNTPGVAIDAEVTKVKGTPKDEGEGKPKFSSENLT